MMPSGIIAKLLPSVTPCSLACAAALSCLSNVSSKSAQKRAVALALRAKHILATVAPGSQFHDMLVARTAGDGENKAIYRSTRQKASRAQASISPKFSVRAVGFCYEIEFGAAGRLGAPIGSVVTVLVFLWLIWRRGVLTLLRPLRMPMRLHAELGLGTTDDEVNRTTTSQLWVHRGSNPPSLPSRAVESASSRCSRCGHTC